MPPKTSAAARGIALVPPAPTVTSIVEGVFFTTPAPLPRGRHHLSREQIQTAQRERLLVAVTELLAAYGHRGFGAGEVAKRAGVSLGAFYTCFADKDECIFAGYDRFIEVLLARITDVDVTNATRTQITHALLGAYLRTLGSDLVVARAYQVEIDSLGPEARRRRRSSLRLFAAYIQQVLARLEPETSAPAEIPWSAYISTVYAARQLAADALDEAAAPDLVALGDNLEIWVSDLFRER